MRITYAGRGPRRIYGDRLDPHAPPEHALCQRSTAHGIETSIYQLKLRHKSLSCPLNVVLIVKTNQQTKRQAHVLLFSSDLALASDRLLDYYCLRFQLEFNFRDAKQYWGLEDWMNVKEVAVTNRADAKSGKSSLIPPPGLPCRGEGACVRLIGMRFPPSPAHGRGARGEGVSDFALVLR